MNIYKCSITECDNYASYGIEPSKISSYCFEHKKQKMNFKIDTYCIARGCREKPMYGSINLDYPTHCSQHTVSNLFLCSYSKCRENECNKYPFYGYNDIRIMCKDHKCEDMYFIYEEKCKKCNDIAMYNFSYSKKPIYCKLHKLDKMKNIYFNHLLNNYSLDIIDSNYPYCFIINNNPIQKKRKFIEKSPPVNNYLFQCNTCKKLPSYGKLSDKIPVSCSEHKSFDMIKLIYKFCGHFNCKLPSINNLSGFHPDYCPYHQNIALEKFMCRVKGCVNPARYSTPAKHRILCHEHYRTGCFLSSRISYINAKHNVQKNKLRIIYEKEGLTDFPENLLMDYYEDEVNKNNLKINRCNSIEQFFDENYVKNEIIVHENDNIITDNFSLTDMLSQESEIFKIPKNCVTVHSSKRICKLIYPKFFCKKELCYRKCTYFSYDSNELTFCRYHNLSETFNLQSCRYKNCNLDARYGIPGILENISCTLHSHKIFVRSDDKKCIINNCKQRREYNYSYFYNPLYCYNHSNEYMIYFEK